jgi:hypothetical protein
MALVAEAAMGSGITRHGFLLIIQPLVAAVFIPVAPVPRPGVATHTVDGMGGVVLTAVGGFWSHFQLGGTQR